MVSVRPGVYMYGIEVVIPGRSRNIVLWHPTRSIFCIGIKNVSYIQNMQ